MLQRWILRVLGREVAAAGFDPKGQQEVSKHRWCSGIVQDYNSYSVGFQGGDGSRTVGTWHCGQWLESWDLSGHSQPQ